MPARNEVGTINLDRFKARRLLMSDKHNIPEAWLKWPEWIPRSWAKEVFDVTTIQGAVYILDALANREVNPVKVRQIDYNPQGQPRWMLNRDDLFEAWKAYKDGLKN